MHENSRAMNLINTVAIHTYHKACIDKFGAADLRALGWKAGEGQEARFRMLSQIGDLTNCSVLDVGCGHGDLSAYLHNQFSGLRYIGIDQLDAFLDVAIERYGHLPDTSFFQGDFSLADLPFTDYILASGALSYRNSDPDFVFKTITKLFNACRVGLGFNLLSAVENPGGILVAYDLPVIMEHCRTLSERVVLKEGYYENDFTVLVLK